jgi:hypothetical protein
MYFANNIFLFMYSVRLLTIRQIVLLHDKYHRMSLLSKYRTVLQGTHKCHFIIARKKSVVLADRFYVTQKF